MMKRPAAKLPLLAVIFVTTSALADGVTISAERWEGWFWSGTVWIGALALGAGIIDGVFHIGRLQYEYPQQSLRHRGRRVFATDTCFASSVLCIVVLTYAWLRPPGEAGDSFLGALLDVLLTRWGMALMLFGTAVFALTAAVAARRPASTTRAAFFG